MLSNESISYKLNRWIKFVDNFHLISKLNVIHGRGLNQIIILHCWLSPNVILNSGNNLL